MSRRHQHLHAFTLIELIGVMAIVGILAGLLFPILGRARASAKRTACISNLRQIAIAVRLYADDSNDATPGAKSNPSKDPFTAFKELLGKYVGEGANAEGSKLFACPSDTFYYDYDTRISECLHRQLRNRRSSYAFNAGNIPPGAPSSMPPIHPWPGIAGRKLSSIKDPSKTLLVVESPALLPYSWHDPGPASHFLNARDVVSRVDGSVGYIKMYWDKNNVAVGRQEAWQYDPPPSYDYKWSAD